MSIFASTGMHMHQQNKKIETLRKFIKRVKVISSDESLQNEEMKYLTKVFHEVNSFPMSIINKTTVRA